MNDQRQHSERKWEKRANGVYLLTGICTKCGADFNNDNVYAASYCPSCAERIRREKTAARVKRHRERQAAQTNTAQGG